MRVQVLGASLHLRWHHGADTRATLLLFHGNGEVVADYDPLAESFRKAGVDLAVVDYRGYGESRGRPTLRLAIEDAQTVLAGVVAKAAGKPIIVMGRSLGSACAAELYGSSLDSSVRAVVFESGFVDLAALIRRRGLEAPDSFDDAEKATFDPLPKLARGRLPLLVLHGEQDQSISPTEGKRAYEAAGAEKKELVLVPGRGHNDVAASETYWEALARFVAQVASAGS
ncbi:MAG: alpha/beta fold hydrolase [Myxococcales bacterium]